jgi:hypothetical protein
MLYCQIFWVVKTEESYRATCFSAFAWDPSDSWTRGLRFQGHCTHVMWRAPGFLGRERFFRSPVAHSFSTMVIATVDVYIHLEMTRNSSPVRSGVQVQVVVLVSVEYEAQALIDYISFICQYWMEYLSNFVSF